MMKTAILGAGTIIPDFLEAAGKIGDMEIYAIFGRESSRDKLMEFQKKYGISKIYHDYDALLADKEVEVVYVALPNHLHYLFAKKAVEAKKHVIVEKPFTSTYEQAKELVELAMQNHVLIFEAISNQYMPNYRKTQELISQVGDVKIVQLNYSQYSRRYDLFKVGTVLPVFDPKKSGGALMDLNVYNIHYVLGLFGKPDRIRYVANIERGIDTSGILVMEYPTFQCVCVAAKDCKAPVSINVQGDKGFIHSDVPANVYGSFIYSTNAGECEEYSLNEGMPRLYHELRTFTDVMLKQDFDEAKKYNQHTLDVMEVLDTARRQVNIEF
jgi:predicted dehydrogenase